MALTKLLFIDTNKFLDHYRARNEAAMGLLKHAEKLAPQIILTYQVEIEFRKHRQQVIIASLKELKNSAKIPTPAILSDASAMKGVARSHEKLEKYVEKLRTRLKKALVNPTVHDPVYRSFKRMFDTESDFILRHDNKFRHSIRRKALRRFLHGCPPRKDGDLSIGDAINWEWMLHCAEEHNAELVICSRDSDYGPEFEGTAYLNDHLRQEFSDRVSRKRKVILCTKLTDALKLMNVSVTKKEVEAENEIERIPLSSLAGSAEFRPLSSGLAGIISSGALRFTDLTNYEALYKVLTQKSKDDPAKA